MSNSVVLISNRDVDIGSLGTRVKKVDRSPFGMRVKVLLK